MIILIGMNYKLANSYMDEEDVAKLRTGMGRFYYASFLESRDYIINRKMFLNKTNKDIMLSRSGRVHRETRLCFEKT